jgi:hypothetical protein
MDYQQWGPSLMDQSIIIIIGVGSAPINGPINQFQAFLDFKLFDCTNKLRAQEYTNQLDESVLPNAVK